MSKIKTAEQFAQACLDVAKNYKTLYVLGCFGAPMNAVNKTRYTNNLDYNKKIDRKAKIKLASSKTFGFDCVCFLKGVLWGWCGDASHQYGGAQYASNGVPDIGDAGMIKVCSNISTDFSNIQVGELLWVEGHVGLYVGDGLAVECTPSWKDGVQITAVHNIAKKSGYNGRMWTKHGKLPYVTYEQETNNIVKPSTTATIKAGDVVTISPYAVYYSGADVPSWVIAKKWIVRDNPVGDRAIIDKSEDGKNSICSPINVKYLTVVGNNTAWTPKVGDIVMYNGNMHYVSANSTSSKSCKGGKAKITNIYQLGKSKHPYHLVRIPGSGSTVYGWVDEETFTKG